MDELQAFRAALISVGYLYEDYTGPLTDAEIESAKRIIKEREERSHLNVT